MTFNQTCLLLGRFKDTVKLKKILSKKNCKVICKNTNVFLKDLKKIDLVVIFNYRHVLKKEILRNLKRPAINLHISYLPYNRGCHPNFWSFIENSPKGVTIHEVDKGLDTGPILEQEVIDIDLLDNFNILSKKLKFLSPIIAFMLYPFFASKFFNANKAIVIAQKNTNLLGHKTVTNYCN